MTDHGEAGKKTIQQIMGDIDGQRGATGSEYAVGYQVNMPLASKGITVGGHMTTLGVIFERNQI